MNGDRPSSPLLNPYGLGAEEVGGPDLRAVLRLVASGGVGACAVAATVLGAGPAQADSGGDFGGDLSGGGGLITVPQSSATATFDTSALSFAASTPVESSSAVSVDPPSSTPVSTPVDSPVPPSTTPAGSTPTVPVISASADPTSFAGVDVSGPAVPANTGPVAGGPIVTSPDATSVTQAVPVPTVPADDSTPAAKPGGPASDTPGGPPTSTPVTQAAVVPAANAAFADPSGFSGPVTTSGTADPASDKAVSGTVAHKPDNEIRTDAVSADVSAGTQSTQTGGTTRSGDEIGVQLASAASFGDRGAPSSATSGAPTAGPSADVGSAGWSAVQVPLDVPIGTTGPAFLPAEPAGVVAPTAETLPGSVGTAADPPGVPLSFAGGGAAIEGVPSTDQVAGRPASPQTDPPDGVLPAESSTSWSTLKVPTAGMPTGWSDRQGGPSSFDAGPAQEPAAQVLSAGSPIAWSEATAPAAGPGSGPMIDSVRIGAGDELGDVSLGGPEQGAMVASLFTEDGRRRVQSLLTTERVVTGRDGLDLFVADVADQLRGVAINSAPLTQEQANLFYPVPAPEHPSLANLPEAMKPTFQAYHDKTNADDAERAMAGRSGFEAPELACWIVCDSAGTSRVLPDLYVGGNYHVDGGESTVRGHDLSDVTDAVFVHTHPLFASADPPQSYDTSGLSAADIGFLDTMAPMLAPQVQPAVASVSSLEGTVTVARRGQVPDGASSSEEGREGGVRAPLLVRVLPSSPGSPVSGDVKIQVDDTGTLDYSLADAVEAPGVSEQRYAAAERAAEVGLDPTALTDPPDLYGSGVVPPGVGTAEGLRSRGLVVSPPVSSIDLPLPTGAAEQPLDPGVDGSNAPSSTVPRPVPSGRDESEPPTRTGTEETVPAEQGNAATATGTAPAGSSAGVVIRPEPGLTPEEQAGLGLIDLPGGWATKPPVELPDLNVPGGRPVDPNEFDPNRPQREKPAVPELSGGPETFPDRPAVDLENSIWTFPRLPDESPTGAAQPGVEPTPSPALRSGTPFTAGDTSWSSAAVQNPLAVQPASTATQPPGDITWSTKKATPYPPPAQAAEAPVKTSWSMIKAKETYPPPVQVAEAPVTLGWSTEKATVPAGWQPGSATDRQSAPASSTSAVKKPAAASVTAPTPAAAASTVRNTAAEPTTANPVQQFADFVGNAYNGAGDAVDKNIVAPVGNALNGAGEAINTNVVTPLIDAYRRADDNARETMSKMIKSSAPLDGVLGIGATRYQVEIMNGAVGEYDADGRLLGAQKGDPPAKVSNPGLYTGGMRVFPAAPGSMAAPMPVPIVP